MIRKIRLPLWSACAAMAISTAVAFSGCSNVPRHYVRMAEPGTTLSMLEAHPENYRGKVGTISFFPTAEAYVVPMGTSVFATHFAPADFMETVNTVGLPVYAKMVFDDELNRWVKLHTQSNPLALCLRPRAVVKVTKT